MTGQVGWIWGLVGKVLGTLPDRTSHPPRPPPTVCVGPNTTTDRPTSGTVLHRGGAPPRLLVSRPTSTTEPTSLGTEGPPRGRDEFGLLLRTPIGVSSPYPGLCVPSVRPPIVEVKRTSFGSRRNKTGSRPEVLRDTGLPHFLAFPRDGPVRCVGPGTLGQSVVTCVKVVTYLEV